LMPYHLGPVTEPLVVLAGTVAGCFVLSEIVKRIPLLRPCFGLKSIARPRATRIAVELRDDCA